jgi:predicted dinucleotide-binding enzyme
VVSFARDETELATLAHHAGPTARVGTPADAARSGAVVLVAVRWDALDAAGSAAGPLDGKVVLTCVSALRPDFTGRTLGLPAAAETSVAERVAALAPGARVVEAFNTTFAELLALASRDFGALRPTLWDCGDDVDAKRTAAALIETCGYEAFDAGPLANARTIETLASVWLRTAVVTGLFPDMALRVLRR